MYDSSVQMKTGRQKNNDSEQQEADDVTTSITQYVFVCFVVYVRNDDASKV